MLSKISKEPMELLDQIQIQINFILSAYNIQ